MAHQRKHLSTASAHVRPESTAPSRLQPTSHSPQRPPIHRRQLSRRTERQSGLRGKFFSPKTTKRPETNKDQIHAADELTLTELILDNALAPYTPAETAALLSSFIFTEKTDVSPDHAINATPNLPKGRDKILKIAQKVKHIQAIHQVLLSAEDGNSDFEMKPERFGLVEVVYEWARGMSFANIMELTDVPEGTIVRVISRLDETLREVKGAARIVGDPELWGKVGEAQEAIRRDICATASLYM